MSYLIAMLPTMFFMIVKVIGSDPWWIPELQPDMTLDAHLLDYLFLILPLYLIAYFVVRVIKKKEKK